jgi:hypothetical protein
MKRHLALLCLSIVISSLLMIVEAFGGDESSGNLKSFAYSWRDNTIDFTMSGYQSAEDIVSDSNGNIYVAGYVDTNYVFPRPKEFDFKRNVIILKFSKYGKFLWARRWGGNDYEWATSVDVGLNGSIYVAGCTQTFGAGGGDVLLLKYNKDGRLIWSKTWGTRYIEQAEAMELDSNENIFIAGHASGNSLILKFDKDGNLLWSKTWGGRYPIYAEAIALDSLGNAYVTGNTQSYAVPTLVGVPDEVQMDVFLLKYSKDGELLWRKTWGRPRKDKGYAISLDKKGNIYVVGLTLNFKTTNEHHFVLLGGYSILLKYSNEGNLLWSKTWAFDERGGTSASDIGIDKKGNIFVSANPTFLLKFNKKDELLWSEQFRSGSRVELIKALALDSFDNILLTGVYAGKGNANEGLWRPKKRIMGLRQIVGEESSPEGDTGSPKGTITSPSGSDKEFAATSAKVNEFGVSIENGPGSLLLRYVQK